VKASFTIFQLSAVILSITASSLIISSCSNIKKAGEQEKLKKKRKIKAIRTFNYHVYKDAGKIEKGKSGGPFGERDTYSLFNKKGRKTEEYKYKNDGSLWYRLTYIYDKNGNNIKENRYDEEGDLRRVIELKYGKNGNKTKEYRYKPDGNPSQVYKGVFKYDKNGNNTEECWYFASDSLFIKLYYLYDKEDRNIEKEWYNYEGGLITKKSYEYDDKGCITTETGYNPKGEIEYVATYNYDFDKNGNWIRKLMFVDNIPKFVIERDIVYYDK